MAVGGGGGGGGGRELLASSAAAANDTDQAHEHEEDGRRVKGTIQICALHIRKPLAFGDLAC